YRVLIVDAAPAVWQGLGWALGETGDLAAVGGAGNGADAIPLSAADAPDVVIFDIELPGLDGYAVARSLKRAQRPPVVVFLTVHGDPESRRQGHEAGADGFAEKGIGWPELISQVRGCLEGAARRNLAPR